MLPKGILPEGIFPRGFWFWTSALLVALFVPLLSDSDYFLSVCVLFALYAAINLMWTLVLGAAGIYSFATLAIAGASGYLAAYFSVAYDWSWPLMLLIGLCAGAVIGLVVALPAIRLRGIYFALLTFGMVELARSFVVQSKALGLSQGLYGAATFVPEELGGRGAALLRYFGALLLLVVALVVYKKVNDGRLGLLLRTARESEPFARAVGVDVVRARLAVFVISSAVLGVTGASYAMLYGGISPTIFDFDTLLLLFAMIVVGGLGSARGVLIGTALLLFIDQRFLDTGAARFIVSGLLMLVVTLATTRGLAGIPAEVREWMGKRGLRDLPPAAAIVDAHEGARTPAGAASYGDK